MRRAALLGDGWMPHLYLPRRYAASVQTSAGSRPAPAVTSPAGRMADAGCRWARP